MPSPFTPDQIATLSAQIDQQLRQLRKESSAAFHKGSELEKQDNPEHLPVQWRIIEKITKEPPRSFWQKFKRVARRDLCEEDGMLYDLWKKYRDLSNDAVLVCFGALLRDMNFSGTELEKLVVPLAVIVIHFGLKIICEED